MSPQCRWLLVVLSLAVWPVDRTAADEVPLGGPPRELVGHDKQITALAYAPDGKTLASAGIDGDVRLWDPVGGKLRWGKRAHEGGAYALAFTPDGKILGSAGADGVVRLWDPAAGREVRRLQGHQGPVAALAWSPDGTLLASGGYDSTIRLWDASSGREVRRLRDGEGRVTALTFFPDGKTLVSGGTMMTVFGGMNFCGEADLLRLWDVTSGKQRQKLPGRGSAIALSPDAHFLVAGGLKLEIEATNDGNVLHGIKLLRYLDLRNGKEFHTIALRGSAVALSPDGMILATGYGNSIHLPGNILGTSRPIAMKMDIRPCLWEMITGKEVLKYPKESLVAVLTFSPDGRTLAAGSYEGRVHLWDPRHSPQGRVSPEIELKAADLDRLWSELAHQDPARAYLSICRLMAAPNQAGALLGNRLRPIHESQLQRVVALIQELNADNFGVRDAATHELRKLGSALEPALRQALASKPPPETCRLLELLLDDLRGGLPNETELRTIRAVQVLEMLGTSEARQVLRRLAQGAPLARQTQDAQAALQRLAKWPPVDRTGGQR